MRIRAALHAFMSNMFAFMIMDILNMNVNFPCILFLGEYEYPKESDYAD